MGKEGEEDEEVEEDEEGGVPHGVEEGLEPVCVVCFGEAGVRAAFLIER